MTTPHEPTPHRLNTSSLLSLTLILAALGGYLLSRPNLTSIRPEPSPYRVHRTLADERVPARLWEDPLVAAQAYFTRLEEEFLTARRIAREFAPAPVQRSTPPAPLEAQVVSTENPSTTRASTDDLGTPSDQSSYRAWLKREFGVSRVHTLLSGRGHNAEASPMAVSAIGVTVSPFSYAEDVERRIRTRNAVVQALLASGFEPQTNRHIGLFAAPLDDLIPSKVLERMARDLAAEYRIGDSDSALMLPARRDLMLYPYEVWEQPDDMPSPSIRRRVIIFWLQQDSGLLSQAAVFGFWTAATDGPHKTMPTIIGPVDSDALDAFQKSLPRFKQAWGAHLREEISNNDRDLNDLQRKVDQQKRYRDELTAKRSENQRILSETERQIDEALKNHATLLGWKEERDDTEKVRAEFAQLQENRTQTSRALHQQQSELDRLHDEFNGLDRKLRDSVPRSRSEVSAVELRRQVTDFLARVLVDLRALPSDERSENSVSGMICDDDQLQEAANRHFYDLRPTVSSSESNSVEALSLIESERRWLAARSELTRSMFNAIAAPTVDPSPTDQSAGTAYSSTSPSPWLVESKINELWAWFRLQEGAIQQRNAGLVADRNQLIAEIDRAKSLVDELTENLRQHDSRISEIRSELDRIEQQALANNAPADLASSLEASRTSLDGLQSKRNTLHDTRARITSTFEQANQEVSTAESALQRHLLRSKKVQGAKQTMEASLDELDRMVCHSPWATNLPQEPEDDTRAVKIVRYLNTDETLMGTVADELKARALSGTSRRGVLIVEGDSRYARAWMKRINQDRRLNIAETYIYLRGIDGRTETASTHTTSPPEASEGKAASAQRELPRPFGASHTDLIERIATDLSRYNNRPDYVILIGSDVFDKLLILRALRPILPGALIITTDLDAAFLSNSELPYTRNLVVVSDSDALTPRITQTKGLPTGFYLRSVYETAVFRATRAALDSPHSTTSPSIPAAQAYEVGRSGFHPLANRKPEVANNAEASKDQPSSDKNVRHPSSAAGDGKSAPSGSQSDNPASMQRGRDSVTVLAGFCAALLIAGCILTSILRTHRPGRPGSFPHHTRYFQTQPNTRLGQPLRLATLAAVVVVAITGAIDIHHELEPVQLFGGISVWPTIVIFMFSALLNLFLILFHLDSLDAELDDAEDRRLGGARLQPMWLPWARTGGYSKTISSALENLRSGVRCNPVTGVIALIIFLLWTVDCVSSTWNIQAIDLARSLFGIEARGIFRSETTWVFYNVVRWLAVSLLILLSTLVILEMRRFRTLLSESMVKLGNDMEAHREIHSSRAGADTICNEVRSMFRTIECRGDVVVSGLVYIGVAVLIALLAKHQLFDNWSWTNLQLSVLATPLVVGLYHAMRLRASAKVARYAFLSLLEDLRDSADTESAPTEVSIKPTDSQASATTAPNAAGGYAIEMIERTIHRIKQSRTGLFAPVLENPMVVAALTPLGGIGALPIISALLS